MVCLLLLGDGCFVDGNDVVNDPAGGHETPGHIKATVRGIYNAYADVTCWDLCQ